MSDQTQSEGLQRPGAASAFGILSIIFGAIALVVQGLVGTIQAFGARASRSGFGGLLSEIEGAVGTESAEAADAMNEVAGMLSRDGGAFFIGGLILAILAIGLGALQLASGVSLLKGGAKAIKLNQIYAFAGIGLIVVRIAWTVTMGMGFRWFGSILGLAYPILILTLVVNNQAVKDWIAKKSA